MKNISCKFNINGNCTNPRRRFFFGLFQNRYCDEGICNLCELCIPFKSPKLEEKPGKEQPEKEYTCSLNIKHIDGRISEWTYDSPKNIKLFQWGLFKDVWLWYYTKEKEIFTIQGTWQGIKGSNTVQTLKREDIKDITGTVKPVDKEEEKQ